MTKMKYRLALKLGLAMNANGVGNGGQAALGWAVMQLKTPKVTKGTGTLPGDQLEGPGEARVIVYAKPEDMIEPMPLDRYDARLKTIAATLPDDCQIVRVPFDSDAYKNWLCDRVDSHQNRAAWAQDDDGAADWSVTGK